jgi:hypothetical protein
MVPPESMAVVGVKAREMETEILPTMRSEERITKETEETREAMPPDDTVFEIEHAFARNLTDPAVAEPIVKPLMVMVNTDAGITAPDVVNVTAMAEVSPNLAVKPSTLLAPESTKGTTEDAKKFEGYNRVQALPERTETDGENPRVTAADDFPETLSVIEMPKV